MSRTMIMVSKFNGTSTPKGSYSAKTGDNDCNVNSSRYSLRTALCEGIRYQAKSEQNVRQDLIPRVRHVEAAESFGINDEPRPLEHPSPRNKALSCEIQVLIALRYYASGCFQNYAADLIGVNKSTVCRAIRRVSSFITRVRYIHMPHDPRVLARSRVEFYAFKQFPRVIACVDGTHVRMPDPSTNEWEYVNCKGYHSIMSN